MLRKRGGPFKRWKKRYFTLTSKVLVYRPAVGKPQVGSVLTTSMLGVREGKKPTQLILIAVHKQYLLEAADKADRDRWVAALRSIMGDMSTRTSPLNVIRSLS